ncbi:hypothetical protein LSH36_175g03003 [Paralvinella palmiformis]|uniref:Titin n=1 Tax=Paralvinella palmiformis TaxID=53620 RepID=A0AAD9JS33_9ANNE|nr:hypothetical protein LSH36_175g03003 [Paralvinella palmiformis]
MRLLPMAMAILCGRSQVRASVVGLSYEEFFIQPGNRQDSGDDVYNKDDDDDDGDNGRGGSKGNAVTDAPDPESDLGGGWKVTEQAMEGDRRRRNSIDRRGSEELGELPLLKRVDIEELEMQQKQRRNSLQARRTSLADVIPGWPLLQKRKVEKVIENVEQVATKEHILDLKRIPEAAELYKNPQDHFLEELEDQQCKEKDNEVMFKCKYSKPNARVRWLKNKLEIFHGHKYSFLTEDGYFKLVIRRIGMEDAGRYTCQADDKTSSAYLEVEEKKQLYYFTQKLPKTTKVRQRKDLLLECMLSDPRPHVKWFKNGEPVEYTPNKIEISRRENRCILRIKNAAPDDACQYTCEVEGDTTTCDVIVDEPEFEFVKQLEDTDCIEKETVEFVCEVNEPDAPVQWFREEKGTDSPIDVKDTKYMIVNDGMKRILRVTNVSGKDEGIYKCKVQDKLTSGKLYVAPDVTIQQGLKNAKYLEGEVAKLQCKVKNPKNIPVKWFRGNKEIEVPSDKYEIEEKKGLLTLLVKDLKLDDEDMYMCKIGNRETTCKVMVDEGMYMCKIGNRETACKVMVDEGMYMCKIGNRETTCKVMVDEGMYMCKIGNRKTTCKVMVDEAQKPPKVDLDKIPRELTLKAGKDLELEIPYTGTPMPKSKWTKDGKPMEGADASQTPQLCKFKLKNVKRGDRGDYQLELTNESGKQLVPITLMVIDRPDKPEGPLRVSDVFKDRCKIEWKPPKDDGGVPVDHYVVQKMDTNTNKWEDVGKVQGDTQCGVPGLTPGRKYKFRVMAVNKEGMSEPLETDKTTTAKDPWDAPGAPGTPEIVDYDKDYATIKWKKPKNDGGSPIQKYIVEKKPKFGDWEKVGEVDDDVEETTVDELDEGKDYEFRVIPVNDAGPGTPSDASPRVFTKARRVKPRIDKKSFSPSVQLKKGHSLSLDIKFTGEPNPVATWTRTGKTLEPSDQITLTNPEHRATMTYKNVQRKDTGIYVITVKNEFGTDSAEIDVIVLGPPDHPMGPLEVSDVKKDSVKLSWKKPKDDGGKPISGYTIEKLNTKKGVWEKVPGTIPRDADEAVVPKLKEGEDYKFRVMAENENGTSEPLETERPVKAKNPFDRPGKPGAPEVDDSDYDHIKIKWNPPKKDGGAPISGYNVERKDPKSGRWIKVNKEPVFEPEFNDAKVQAKKAYEYRVTALNEGGESDPSEVSKPIKARPLKEAPKLDLSKMLGGNEIRVRAGEPIKIDVPITGSPTPTITWKKDDKGLEPSSRVNQENDEDNAKLLVPVSKRGDTGKYTIKLANKHGEDSGDINVIVLDKPGSPEDLKVSDVYADHCTLSWKHPTDDGGADINDYIVEKCEEGNTFWEKVPGLVNGTQHVVKDLEEGKRYKFRVKAENPFGVSEPCITDKSTLAKNPYDPPTEPRDIAITEFDKSSVTLKWKAPTEDGGNPIKGYVVEKRAIRGKGDWTPVNNVPVKDTHFKVANLIEGSDVEFRVAAVNDAGLGKPSKSTGSHRVRDPIFAAGAPSQPALDEITPDHVKLSWQKPSDDGGGKIKGYIVEVKPKGGDWSEATPLPIKDTQCVVPNLKEGQEYQFRVKALNEAGPGNPSRPTQSCCSGKTTRPSFGNLGKLKEIVVKAGQRLEIPIPINGHPPPITTWEKDGQPIEKGHHNNTQNTTNDKALFAVPKAARDDTGKYTIKLKNDSGMAETDIRVIVLDKPSSPEGPLEAIEVGPNAITMAWKPPKDDGGAKLEKYVLEKRPKGSQRWQKVPGMISPRDTEATVRNLDQGQDYEFRVMAVNEHGESEPLVTDQAITAKHPFDPPGKPGVPECDGTTEDSITLKWDRPLKDGGKPIKGYLVEKREKGAKRWTKVTPVEIPDEDITIRGLVEDKPYEFRVAAVNEAGPGEWVETDEAIKPQPPPSAPKILLDPFGQHITVPAGEPFKIKVPYKGSPAPTATFYNGIQQVTPNNRIRFETTPDEVLLICRAAEKSDQGTYNVTLKNPKGQDSCTINVTVQDKPGNPEGPLEATDITPDSCKLKWKPPKDDGGSPVSHYMVEKKDRSGKWTPVSKFCRGNSCDVTDLEEGESYEFRVSAVNEQGQSEPLITDRPIIAKHPFDAPGAPGRPIVDDVDADSVTLSWTKPRDDGGNPVKGYVIEMREKGSSKWKPLNDRLPCKDTKFTADGLDSDREYEFRVRAKNKAGLGEPSSGSGEVQPRAKATKASPPGLPNLDKVGKNTVDLSWSKPRNDGGSKIKGYQVEKRKRGGLWEKVNDYPIMGESTTVSDLVEGDEYEFRVAAVTVPGTGEYSLPTAPIIVREKKPGVAAEIVRKPSNTLAPLGTDARFEIELCGEPEPEVKWFRDGIPLRSGNKYRINRDGNVAQLIVKDVHEGDGGEITCEVSNAKGHDTATCKLNVQTPPEFARDIKDQSVDKGDTLKVKVPFNGKGPFDYKLKKNGRDIPIDGDRVKLVPFDDYMVLQIKDAEPGDTGKYRLEVSNDSGTGSIECNVKVKATPGKCRGPLLVSDITKISANLKWKPPEDDGGSRITHYIVEKKEPGKPYWGTVASFVKDIDCDVQGLIENREYFFRVAACNENGTGDFLEIDKPIIAKLPFDAPASPGCPDVEEVGGDFVSLTWEKPKSDGGGKIKGYYIEKKDANSDNWLRVNRKPTQATIFNVPNLIEDREYEFRIIAINEAGESKPSIGTRKVKVKDPKAACLPEFTQGLRTIQGVQGRSVKFEVEVNGQPAPEIVWFKGTRELLEGDKYEMTKEGNTYVLIIHDIYGEDADEYCVKAINKAGSRSSRADLKIKTPPKINVPPRFADVASFDKGEDIVLKIPFTGNPKPTATWLKDGNEITSGGRYRIETGERHAILTIKGSDKMDDGPYRLSLENDLGTDSAVIKIQINDIPDPPRFLQVDTIYHDSVMLTWKPPLSDGGGFITQYILEKLEPPMTNWIRCCTTRFTHACVENLSPSKDYQFRVMAENLYGRSEPCEPTSIVKTETPEEGKKKKGICVDEETGRRRRGKYEGPKIADYDKLYYDLWNKIKPQPVEVKSGSVYDYFDICEELGTGAFGVVHRAVEKSTGRNFVAKFINTPYPADKNTVKNEINIMNCLHHKKLLNLYDAFEDRHEMVLILEYLSGGELFDRVADEDYKMTEAEVINYVRQVCEGLKHMHENNIVHLDIKPENVLATTKKSTDVKLIDFGLAAKLDPEQVVKVTTATAEFAAPEVVEHDAVGFYTDMWAVGVLAYILLSGLSPFAGDDDAETLNNVSKCDWDFDSDAFKGVSQEAKDFIKKLILKTPQRRMTVHEALDHSWLSGDHADFMHRIPSSRYNKIREKIKRKYADWPAPMPAIGRIANFSSLRKHRPKEHHIIDSYFDRKEAMPRFIRKPHSCVVQEGGVASFKCKVIAASEPTITWSYKNIPLNPSIKYMPKYAGHNYELRVCRCKMEDKGEYVVKAENSYGTKEERAFLNVEPATDRGLPRRAMSVEPLSTRRKKILDLDYMDYKEEPDAAPFFTFPLRDRFIQGGSGVKLICTLKAKPPPTIIWTKDGKEIRSASKYELTYSLGICSLEMQTCEVEDGGRYTCRAENEKGTDETACKVTVNEKIRYTPIYADSSDSYSVSTSSVSSYLPPSSSLDTSYRSSLDTSYRSSLDTSYRPSLDKSYRSSLDTSYRPSYSRSTRSRTSHSTDRSTRRRFSYKSESVSIRS